MLCYRDDHSKVSISTNKQFGDCLYFDDRMFGYKRSNSNGIQIIIILFSAGDQFILVLVEWNYCNRVTNRVIEILAEKVLMN